MNKKVRNVLSLFDGVSICQESMKDCNISYDICYSSEIDKFATAITRYNYPNTVHLGDVTKWKSWNIDWSTIDILFAGFPCQSWSVAGKELGDRDPRGQLLWDMMDILNHIRIHNPNIKYLFENVKMKDYFMVYCTNVIGIQPILINSTLVSGQNRERYYWTNIHSEPVGLLGDYFECKIPQPEDRKIFLKDVLEKVVDAKYLLSDERLKLIEIGNHRLTSKIEDVEGKSQCLTAAMGMGGGYVPKIKTDGSGITGGLYRHDKGTHWQDDGKCGTLLARARNDIYGLPFVKIKQATKLGYAIAEEGDSINLAFPNSTTRRGRVGKGKAQTLDCMSEQFVYTDELVRRLTPLECERLQTFRDYYTKYGTDSDGKTFEISDTQRYKSIGNSWTRHVINHILSFFDAGDDI